jgi:hypothetical protein
MIYTQGQFYWFIERRCCVIFTHVSSGSIAHHLRLQCGSLYPYLLQC